MVEDKIYNKLHKENQELRAGYTALVQLVQTYRMCRDVDIDWDKFPANCLCDAHKEILKLRKKLLKYEPAPTIYDNDPEMLDKLNKLKEYLKKDKKIVVKKVKS